MPTHINKRNCVCISCISVQIVFLDGAVSGDGGLEYNTVVDVLSKFGSNSAENMRHRDL